MKTFTDLVDLDAVEYHPRTEQLVNALVEKTQSNAPAFFRIQATYHFAKVASMMRASIKLNTFQQPLPINIYAVNLAPSGVGKGHSTNIIEEQVTGPFRTRFTEETFLILAKNNIDRLASRRAVRKNTKEEDEKARAIKEFNETGPLLFSFDSGTPAAVKQARHKLLMAHAGSLNLEIDEIGSNLLGNIEVLTTFLELYDVGKIKQKLVKNTNENQRYEDIPGLTPTNMLLFGTPTKLLNGAKIEDEFMTMLETGYARRSLFGMITDDVKGNTVTAEQMYKRLSSKDSNDFLSSLGNWVYNLADISKFGQLLTMAEENEILLLTYRIYCEQRANAMAEHEEIRKAEMTHRHFKALKVAGTYAFIDNKSEITREHLLYAFKLTEESGEAFKRVLTREKPYVKLAKYLGTVDKEVTQADLIEDLPYYKGSAGARNEMMNLAIAWGYKNMVLIKKSFVDGIEFYSGDAIAETNLDEIRVAYSRDITTNYVNATTSFDNLHKMTQADGIHWLSHHLVDGDEGKGYRKEENAIAGFNFIVLDVDGTASLDTVRSVLRDYKYLIYTTKSHKPDDPHFRILLPITYELKLTAEDYKQMMVNIYEWLPFDVDTVTNQRARKWQSYSLGQHWYNDGKLLDIIPFVPKTTKNEEHRKQISDLKSLSNLERWFVMNTGNGNRSNQMIRYGLMLVDAGKSLDDIENGLHAFNNKLQDKLSELEIANTIMKTVSKRFYDKKGT